MQAVVIDNGSGYTKMGYAGNLEPDFIVPTVITDLDKKSSLNVSTKNHEYNYYIGDEAINKTKESKNHKLTYPVKNGIIENWDLMEKFWYQSIFDYLKCDPQEHYFVLTESPINPPENRENIAEIFFETFNVPGLYIGIQESFSLLGFNKTLDDTGVISRMDEDQKKAIRSLTGVVVDSGDDITNIVPICDGFVLGSNIKHIPIGGRTITKFMEQMFRERGEKINTEDLFYAAMELKEKYSYLAKNLIDEFAKFDKKENVDGKLTQSIKFKTFEGIGKISNKPYSINVGYELFLGPEAYFSPEIIDKNWKVSLDEIIDLTIQQCPMDYRRRLYSDIVFSGGSSLIKNLDRKLEISLQKRVNNRLEKYSSSVKKNTIHVKVNNSLPQKYLSWVGGSYFSICDDFNYMVHTRKEYQEKGPSCCRFNAIFKL